MDVAVRWARLKRSVGVIARVRFRFVPTIATAVELVGFACLSRGAFTVHEWLGWVVTGAILVWLANTGDFGGRA